jgi:hypothetical protein
MPSPSSYDLASCGSMVSACLVAAVVSGCAYPNQFRNAEAKAPHALLTADAGDHWRDRGPTVVAISSQPTSFWRSKERFRIPPGPTTLKVIADREPYDFAPLRFDAIVGRHYHIRYGDARSSVALYDVTDHSSSSLLKTSAREVQSSSGASTQRGEPDGPANGSQPFSSETNSTSSAAGSRR